MDGSGRFSVGIVVAGPKNVPDTNGGSLRSRSSASEQPIVDFGPRMQFLCVKLGKIWLKEPPFVPEPFSYPA